MGGLDLAAHGMGGDGVDLPAATRVEVITDRGREYVLVLNSPGAYAQVQDDGRTLKIFVNE